MLLKIKPLLTYFTLLFCLCYGYAQNKDSILKGYIKTNDGIGITNAVFFIDNTKTELEISNTGFYKLKVNSNIRKITVVTLLGSQTINFKQEKRLDFTFENDGTTYTKNTFKKNKEKEVDNNIKYGNIFDMLIEIPGVYVSGSSINIRGANSVKGSTSPLLIVDGFEVNSIADIRPSEVDDIEVLKGSNAAIYGNKGGSGVIIIKLKKGSDK